MKAVNFFGVKRVAPSSTLKMRKSKKNRDVYTHTHTRIRNYGMVGADLVLVLDFFANVWSQIVSSIS